MLKQALLKRGVPYALLGKSVTLVVDAHAGPLVSVEDAAGEDMGRASTPGPGS